MGKKKEPPKTDFQNCGFKLTCKQNNTQSHTILKHKFYPYRASEDALSFTFKSISEERVVPKKAEFTVMSENVYNFAFGDLDDKGEIDDLAITNNKDTHLVFATVIQILLDFLDNNESKLVYFKGSTPARTRMYQIILRKEKANWKDRLIVYGIKNDDTIPFKTDCKFDAFICKTKQKVK
ncbi:hypothetical protein L0663_22830 [Dyadobacter sp. CY107]|uniref:DUF6934 family protein n=1 Tax=Dyadobacter fanqingshengii TaxID=2906443 RepID=UPI001F25DE1A|nr:hypothetical protein [Dyadobacter fanqingshengii]MCF2506247.1 hypothetical protein [Dyadobacter fanqingshengii]